VHSTNQKESQTSPDVYRSQCINVVGRKWTTSSFSFS